MTAAPVGEVLQGFFSDASPMVTSAMREAVTGVLGGLPREVRLIVCLTMWRCEMNALFFSVFYKVMSS